jgi:hypothetical protein
MRLSQKLLLFVVNFENALQANKSYAALLFYFKSPLFDFLLKKNNKNQTLFCLRLWIVES